MLDRGKMMPIRRLLMYPSASPSLPPSLPPSSLTSPLYALVRARKGKSRRLGKWVPMCRCLCPPPLFTHPPSPPLPSHLILTIPPITLHTHPSTYRRAYSQRSHGRQLRMLQQGPADQGRWEREQGKLCGKDGEDGGKAK